MNAFRDYCAFCMRSRNFLKYSLFSFFLLYVKMDDGESFNDPATYHYKNWRLYMFSFLLASTVLHFSYISHFNW